MQKYKSQKDIKTRFRNISLFFYNLSLRITSLKSLTVALLCLTPEPSGLPSTASKIAHNPDWSGLTPYVETVSNVTSLENLFEFSG